jgi:hypothetical protein
MTIFTRRLRCCVMATRVQRKLTRRSRLSGSPQRLQYHLGGCRFH